MDRRDVGGPQCRSRITRFSPCATDLRRPRPCIADGTPPCDSPRHAEPVAGRAHRPCRRVRGAAVACTRLFFGIRIMVRAREREPRIAPRSASSRPARFARSDQRRCPAFELPGPAVDPRIPRPAWMRDDVRDGPSGDATGASSARSEPDPGSAAAAPSGFVAPSGRDRPSGGASHAGVGPGPARRRASRRGAPSGNLDRGPATLRDLALSLGSRSTGGQARSRPAPQAVEMADRLVRGKRPSRKPERSARVLRNAPIGGRTAGAGCRLPCLRPARARGRPFAGASGRHLIPSRPDGVRR